MLAIIFMYEQIVFDIYIYIYGRVVSFTSRPSLLTRCVALIGWFKLRQKEYYTFCLSDETTHFEFTWITLGFFVRFFVSFLSFQNKV